MSHAFNSVSSGFAPSAEYSRIVLWHRDPCIVRRLEFAADAENPEVVEEALYHKDYPIVAVRIWRPKKETVISYKRQRIVNDSLGDLTILEPDLDPQSFNLRIALKKLYFDVVGPSFQCLHEKQGLGLAQIDHSVAAVGKVQLYLCG